MVEPLVQCETCGEIMTSEEAAKHKEQTGHDSWTILRGIEDAD